MYVEYSHKSDKDTLKYKIDDHVEKLDNLPLQGNFVLTELNKSWINYEMQFSMILSQGVLERSIKGILKIKEDIILISFEVPDTIKNFITEQKLQILIKKHLDNITAESV